MRWWHRRQDVRAGYEAVENAEKLRDKAQEQQRRVEAIAPRVDAAAESLRQLRQDNHVGPMIESILRGAK